MARGGGNKRSFRGGGGHGGGESKRAKYLPKGSVRKQEREGEKTAKREIRAKRLKKTNSTSTSTTSKTKKNRPTPSPWAPAASSSHASQGKSSRPGGRSSMLSRKSTRGWRRRIPLRKRRNCFLFRPSVSSPLCLLWLATESSLKASEPFLGLGGARTGRNK